MEKNSRNSTQSLRNLRIPNQTGQLFPLYQFEDGFEKPDIISRLCILSIKKNH